VCTCKIFDHMLLLNIQNHVPDMHIVHGTYVKAQSIYLTLSSHPGTSCCSVLNFSFIFLLRLCK
jgi:hypothetical protein